MPMLYRLPILFCFSFLLLITACTNPPEKKQANNTPAQLPADTVTIKPITDTTITIAAVGDMMLGTSYPDSTHLPPDSGRQSFRSALKDLKNNDIIFGNLEGTLLDTGAAVAYKLQHKSKGYFFRMPTYYGGVFKSAGFNLISLANNHVDDFGKPGRKSTAKILDSLGINYAGLRVKPSATFTVKGIKYGFCAFSPNSQTAPLLDRAFVKGTIAALKQECDIVIVSFHGGGEGVPFEHIPCVPEYYVGENRGNVNAFAHAAIDAGADLVLGNGPHVSRAMEVYKNRLIAYSLGNFCTYKSVSVLGVCGLAPLLKVTLNKKGHFLSGRIVSYKQSHEVGLLADTANTAANRIRLLTKSDFELPGLIIADDGMITRVAY
ncbi:CapA family protein [Mucilaginibacter glaciei]|uniref:CapA family protein n=1 Tax=Mucilaginibacter glaciei TaxID=2772109 RepID=A0A926NRZ4_9SPHI|nr:CapA family protein [Mucilaginibacter glaciei]MBD1393932.1 CapA family protein [Mucilaginibacter glaciei]